MTSTLPPVQDVRNCHLYRFWVRHPITGEKVLGYIGETARLPFERLMEHVMSQPWADTIVAWEVDDVIYPGKAAVLEAERAAVEDERPLYNHEWNLANPDRVEIWRAKQQRWARDDASRRRRWVEPVKGARRTSTPMPADHRRFVARKWRVPQVKAGLWSAAWLLLAVTVLGGFRQWAPHVDWQPRLTTAGVLPLVLLMWALLRPVDTVRLWRRRLRKVRKLLR